MLKIQSPEAEFSLVPDGTGDKLLFNIVEECLKSSLTIHRIMTL